MNNKTVIGLIFIVLGLFLATDMAGIFDNLFGFGSDDIVSHFWASMFIIPVGLIFHLGYFMSSRRPALAGLLIPGGIILGVGVICQIATLFDSWGTMWPGFPLAVAFGLLEFYIFGYRNKWLLIPILILSSMSIVFFSIFTFGAFFSLHAGRVSLAIFLILIGVLVMFGRGKNKDLSRSDRH